MDKAMKSLLAVLVIGLGVVARGADSTEDTGTIEVFASVSVSVRGIYAEESLIEGALTLGYAPTESQNAVVKVGEDEVVNANEAGSIVLSAPTMVTYVISHTVGDDVLAATYREGSASVTVPVHGIYADGSSIDGALTLGYAPTESQNAIVKVGEDEVVNTNEAGCVAWFAQTAGEYGISHTVGDDVLSAVYNVVKACPSITYANLRGATHSNPARYHEGETLTFAAPSAAGGWIFAGWTPAAITDDMTGPQTVTANWKMPDPVVTPGNGAVFTGEECTVSLTCAVEGAKIYYTTNGVTPKLTEKYRYTSPFTITNRVSIIAIAECDGLKSGYVTAVIAKKVLTLAEVLGLESVAGVSIETGSDAEWKPILDTTLSTGVSAQSAAIEDGKKSWLKATVNGKGTFSFKWKVDCEDDPTGATWDHLEVLVDSNEVDRIDGATDWAEKTITFTTEGAHTIYWAYVKDEDPSDEEGPDCAWVADCKWTPELFPKAETEKEVSAAFDGAKDTRLARNITTVEKYTAFRTWVDKIVGTGATARQAVKDSELAWFAYALDLSALPEKAPESLTIETIGSAAEGGWDLDVSIGDLKVGDGATAADLGTVFVVEGAADLTDESFSAENVTTTFSAAGDGELKVGVAPKDAAGQFFFRMKMMP
jgi:hypothetical protein